MAHIALSTGIEKLNHGTGHRERHPHVFGTQVALLISGKRVDHPKNCAGTIDSPHKKMLSLPHTAEKNQLLEFIQENVEDSLHEQKKGRTS